MSLATRFGVLIAIVGLCGGVLAYSVVQEVAKNSVDQAVRQRLDRELEDATDVEGRIVLPPVRPLFDLVEVNMTVE